MTRNQSFKRFLSGTIGAVMFLSSLPRIAANAVVGTTVLTYDDYEVSYAVTNEWEGGRNVLITVTNLSDESLYNWAFKYDEAGTMENLYNAVVFDNEDTQYVIKNNGWNFEIAPQRSVSFGYTVHGDELTVPSEFELCSERIDVTEGYEVEVEYVDTWNDGMRGEIIVTNTTEEPLEAWTLAFDTNFQIEYVWNGRAVDTDGNHYVITSEAWTQYLAPGESKSIGFVGTIEPGTDPEFSNYALSAVKINGIEEEGPIIDIDMDTDNIDLGYIENLIGADLITANFDENSRIRAIDGKFTNKPVNTAEDAAAILNCARTLFGTNFHADAENIEIQTDGDEIFFRFTPVINGVEVPGSQIIISAKDGVATGLFSTYTAATESINTTASISSEDAVNAAFEDFFATYSDYVTIIAEASGLTEDEVKALYIESFDVTAERAFAISGLDTQTLVWRVDMVNNYDYPDDLDLENDDVHDYAKYIFSGFMCKYDIYAEGEKAGTVLRKDDSNYAWEPARAHGEDLDGADYYFDAEKATDDSWFDSGYRMVDPERDIEIYEGDVYTDILGRTRTRLPGNIVSSSTDEFNNQKAVSTFRNFVKVYDYYKDELGRDSYDDAHHVIQCTINFQNSSGFVDNAAWNSSQQQFKIWNGGTLYTNEKSLDVIGHEFTHAVVSKTAKFQDGGLTGALNEGYADVMGSLIEGKGRASDGFHQFGEDAGNVCRDLKDPESILNSAGDPKSADHYDDTKDPTWIARAANDDGGEHLFSTIFSHAAYLMIVDSDCNSITQREWAKVFYSSLCTLSSGATFWDARYAVIRAAKRQGFNGQQQTAIKDAFDAVGITEPEALRIVLTWGATPSDLDSHLTGPAVSGSGRFHTYYSARNYYTNGSYTDSTGRVDYAAELDYDDTDSYGPEITTIHHYTAGDYFFYVHDYSNRHSTTSTAMSNSGVTVKIYKGSSNTLAKLDDGTNAVFTIPSQRMANLWKVCRITFNDAGVPTITKWDTYSDEVNPSSVGQ